MSKAKRKPAPKRWARAQEGLTDSQAVSLATMATAVLFVETAAEVLQEEYDWSKERAAEFATRLLIRAGRRRGRSERRPLWTAHGQAARGADAVLC